MFSFVDKESLPIKQINMTITSTLNKIYRYVINLSNILLIIVLVFSFVFFVFSYKEVPGCPQSEVLWLKV